MANQYYLLVAFLLISAKSHLGITAFLFFFQIPQVSPLARFPSNNNLALNGNCPRWVVANLFSQMSPV
jgi:hypothetical protein